MLDGGSNCETHCQLETDDLQGTDRKPNNDQGKKKKEKSNRKRK